jgi:hypothetical protein
VIVANPLMIDAYRAGVPGNGKHLPDGSKIVKITWNSKQNEEAPFSVSVPDTLAAIGCMVKDGSRFPDSGGWGFAQFNDGRPANAAAHDACFPCHRIVEARDFVFDRYAP